MPPKRKICPTPANSPVTTSSSDDDDSTHRSLKLVKRDIGPKLQGLRGSKWRGEKSSSEEEEITKDEEDYSSETISSNDSYGTDSELDDEPQPLIQTDSLKQYRSMFEKEYEKIVNIYIHIHRSNGMSDMDKEDLAKCRVLLFRMMSVVGYDLMHKQRRIKHHSRVLNTYEKAMRIVDEIEAEAKEEAKEETKEDSEEDHNEELSDSEIDFDDDNETQDIY